MNASHEAPPPPTIAAPGTTMLSTCAIFCSTWFVLELATACRLSMGASSTAPLRAGGQRLGGMSEQ